MLVKPWSEKPVTLVDPWVFLAREARTIPIFSQIISSQQISSPSSFPSVAEEVYGSLMILGTESKDPVKIVINSPGGDIQAGFTIIQAMNHLKAKGIEVWTVNLCQSMSMGGIILMMGTPRRRYALENTLTHTHFGLRGAGGAREHDIEEVHKYQSRLNQTIYEMISDNSKIPELQVKRMDLAGYDKNLLKNKKERVKLVKAFIDNETLMAPEEALEAGMIDKVLLPGDPIIDAIYQKGIR
ncbi:MAG: ATP-dependent Clp protease proteolytic subunit [Candidatus Yanofskybacteria bacterium GW2011_GWA2_44_9]|nr:MAG: ATP-dependent Clp protease proteolytic subunit [Candidatus Yanofskybacteria bacterium GW2011_GWA2_44_9]